MWSRNIYFINDLAKAYLVFFWVVRADHVNQAKKLVMRQSSDCNWQHLLSTPCPANRVILQHIIFTVRCIILNVGFQELLKNFLFPWYSDRNFVKIRYKCVDCDNVVSSKSETSLNLLPCLIDGWIVRCCMKHHLKNSSHSVYALFNIEFLKSNIWNAGCATIHHMLHHIVIKLFSITTCCFQTGTLNILQIH